MQTNKLFARIWRINAIIIFIIGLLALVLLLALCYVMIYEAVGTRHVDNVANVALGEVKSSVAELGDFEDIVGSAVLRAPLLVKQSYALGAGSKEAGSIRNYLFFDPTTRTTSWLRPTMDSLILRSIDLPSTGYGESKKDVVVFVHVTIEQDTDKDDRLTESDAKQIAVSSPNGKNYRVLVAKADRLNKATLLPSGRLLVLYSSGAKLSAIELDPKDLSLPVNGYEIATAQK